jgi:hypothetical protein
VLIIDRRFRRTRWLTAGTQTVAKEQALEPVMSWLANATEPAPPDPVVEAQADEVVTKLLTIDPAQADKVSVNKQAIENLGGAPATRGGTAKRDAEGARAQALRGRDRTAARSPTRSSTSR